MTAHNAPFAAGGRNAALVIAADCPTRAKALELAGRLRSLPVWIKLGLELFTAEGPGMVKEFAEQGLPVFLDLKFHDIPNTVYGAVSSAASLAVRMLTVHTCGGEAMCRAAVKAKEDRLRACGAKRDSLLLMGVTVLTSQGGDEAAIRAEVVRRARHAQEWGLDGIVCSGKEAGAVKQACGDDFLCLCPGIRFAGTAGNDDQARVLTPAQAVAEGADFLVMGRPVTLAADPTEAAQRALAAMHNAYSTDI